MLSIIVCYRNREEHLKQFVPAMREFLKDKEYEIIIVEQNDNEGFKRGNLLNEGAKIAKGDILVFHDVDYIPDTNVSYEGTTDVYTPVKRVVFIDENGIEKQKEDIPAGYRSFNESVDDNFYGGVTVMTNKAFKLTNGFNPLYQTWGKEEEDLINRVNFYGLNISRGNGTFKALPHKDSFPGLNDEKFQMNQQIFSNWKSYIELGASTTFPAIHYNKEKAEVYNVDEWIEVTNFLISSKELEPFMNIKNMTDFYNDDSETHTAIWNNFKQLVNSTPILKQHRDFVITNNFGYGNRSLVWLWQLLIKEMPLNFKALEIGVFKGQTISLMSLLNKIHKKNGMIHGVTPLSNAGDKYSKHPDVDYEAHIQQIYMEFGLDASDLTILNGFSNDPNIIKMASSAGPFDIIYVDGSHDYEVVVSDLINYGNMLKEGGYLVIDDASCNLNIPKGLIRMDWKGLPDVCRALSDTIEKDTRFIHKFAVGHNRIFQKVSL